MISFVIRTLNEGAYIERTLREIGSQVHEAPVEIIIVDSGSTDDTLVIAEKFGAKIVHIRKEIWSWGRSLNLGIKNAQGDIIVIISGHCYLATDSFIDVAMNRLQEHDAIYGRQIALPRMDPFEEFELAGAYPENTHIELDKDLLIGVSNACCVMRRSAWEIQQFDENAQSMEDGIWAYGALLLNMKLAYTSAISVYHSHSFEPGNIYRRWYARTLESRNFGAIIFEKNRFYNFKQRIKNNFLFPIIVLKYLMEFAQLLNFKKIGSYLGFRTCHLFLLLKYTAIYNANKDFSDAAQKRYWECRQPVWLNNYVAALAEHMKKYLDDSPR